MVQILGRPAKPHVRKGTFALADLRKFRVPLRSRSGDIGEIVVEADDAAAAILKAQVILPAILQATSLALHPDGDFRGVVECGPAKEEGHSAEVTAPPSPT